MGSEAIEDGRIASLGDRRITQTAITQTATTQTDQHCHDRPKVGTPDTNADVKMTDFTIKMTDLKTEAR